MAVAGRARAALDRRVRPGSGTGPGRSRRRSRTSREPAAACPGTVVYGMPIGPPFHVPEPKSAFSPAVGADARDPRRRLRMDRQAGDVCVPERVGRGHRAGRRARNRPAVRESRHGHRGGKDQEQEAHEARAASRHQGRVTDLPQCVIAFPGALDRGFTTWGNPWFPHGPPPRSVSAPSSLCLGNPFAGLWPSWMPASGRRPP